MGCVLQSSFGKYLLVETQDKYGVEAEQMPDKYGAGADDYHDDGTDHTHPPTKTDLDQQKAKDNVMESTLTCFDQNGVEMCFDGEDGEDYHDTAHNHSPDSHEENATNQTTLEAGQDYHDTGYYHTHSPDSMEGNIEGGNDSHSTEDDGSNEAISKTLEDLLAKIPTKKRTGKDYHDTGFAHTHSPKARRNNKYTRNKKRKTSKKRTPKRMRPRWSNVH